MSVASTIMEDVNRFAQIIMEVLLVLVVMGTV